MLWDGTYGFSPLSKKTRKSYRLQMLLQRQNFLLSYLMALSVGAAGVWTRDLPLSRPALSQLSYLEWAQFLTNFCFIAILSVCNMTLLTLLVAFCTRRRSKGQHARSEIISDPLDIQKVGSLDLQHGGMLWSYSPTSVFVHYWSPKWLTTRKFPETKKQTIMITVL